MHLFACRPYAHAKVTGCTEQVGQVSSRLEDGIIVAIDGFEILGHMLIDFSFKIPDLSRGATVKVVVDLDGDFFHGFKAALKSCAGQEKMYLQVSSRTSVL
jgi:hypothetical protein